MYVVVYTGAPYGGGEYEVVSRHRTLATAERARVRLEDDPRYYRHVHVKGVTRRGRRKG